MDHAALDVAYNNTAPTGNAKRDQYVTGRVARGKALRTQLGDDGFIQLTG
jgi:hypothetical protein